jgi:hypothetical protein
MTRTPRFPKSLAVTIGLVIVLSGGGMLTAAALSGGETFAALQRGDPAYTERSLSASTVTLGVHVAAIAEGERPQPQQGVMVMIYKWTADGAEGETRALTNERGVALFDLRPQRYIIGIQYEGETARHALSLQADTRLSVVIDEEGQIHFQTTSREQIRERGSAHNLFVRVAEVGEDRTRQVVEGANVHIYTLKADGTRGDAVARNATDARGGASFYLHEGRYIVSIETPEGAHHAFRIALSQDTNSVVTFMPDGSASTSTQGSQTQDDPARERPQRERPEREPASLSDQDLRRMALWRAQNA